MFTLDDLIQIMRSCAGVDEGTTLDESILDVPYGELGYESLAVLQILSQIELEHGVTLADDAIRHVPTPRKTIEYVNQHLASEV